MLLDGSQHNAHLCHGTLKRAALLSPSQAVDTST